MDDCYEVAHGFKVGVSLGRRRVNEDRSEDGPYGQGGSRTWHPSGQEKSLIQQPSGSALFQSRSQNSPAEPRCYWRHKLGHKKNQCPGYQEGKIIPGR